MKIPPVAAVPPLLMDFADLDRGRCTIAISPKPGVWHWQGPLDGERHHHEILAHLGIRTAQMRLEDGRFALIGWWTPSTPKRKRF